mgnify:CR=1 FL=1
MSDGQNSLEAAWNPIRGIESAAEDGEPLWIVRGNPIRGIERCRASHGSPWAL